ncbi:unnamed protein product [Linum tenue]|uniref:Uncharacterized protein n=1 Tax=Linum tenue TaxID=586396 RepID=A0AAV0N3V1_9ROSI|nr:unnamed protein product [Linum tenue]
MCILDQGATSKDVRPPPLRHHAPLLVYSGRRLN